MGENLINKQNKRNIYTKHHKVPQQQKPKHPLLMSSTAERIKGGKIYVKPFNYICGLCCIGSGVLAFFDLFKGEAVSSIYSYFAPAYFVIFGLMMIASDLNLTLVIENCTFLDKYAGRGFFNVFVGSQILEQARMGTDADLFYVAGSIIAYGIMGLGLYLIVLHCCENEKSINGNLQDFKKKATEAAIKSQLK